ncbi:MAG: hypothetical protein JXB07_17645 [Anaerolineae bacterium]|nr:hypothetical protein [Anaerolineae bacterium]
MSSKLDILNFAWKRRLDRVLEEPGEPKKTSIGEMLGMLPVIMRTRRHINRALKTGQEPVIDPFGSLEFGPYGGVPLGGIGGGSIMRGWQGDFCRWQMRPGMIEYCSVPADQFSVYIRRGSNKPRLQVLYTGRPQGGGLHGWTWGLEGRSSTYHALFPRAWTVYEEPDPKVKLTCRQISPVIPHNYEESSTPAGVFAWTIENNSKETATVSLMFTFQNGTGDENDRAAGHWNQLFRQKTKGGEIVGVEMHHVLPQVGISDVGDEDDEVEEVPLVEDPLTFAIAAQASDDVKVTYRTRFVTSSSGMDVWGDFANNGTLENVEDEKKSSAGLPIGAALCATVQVPPGKSREVTFALAWDMPLARFGEGRAHYRRYTRFYGREGNAAPAIAHDALLNYPAWEKQIEAWQAPILSETGLPDWYKAALFNELYFITDGGTIWTDGEEGEPPLQKNDIGHFAYLEGHEYRMYNTYDVHFYASFALAMLWPDLELGLQRDIARAIQAEHPEIAQMLGSGKKAARKVKGAVPHDIGSPVEDPWYKVNSYNFQDTNRWKDLNSKFVLQVYRDVIATGDKRFAAEMWEPVQEALTYLRQFDLDEDGMIENEGFPDQTYDYWVADDVSAYSGGLWLAALGAAAALGDLLKNKETADSYRQLLAKAQAVYEEILWNGEYYDYDASTSSHHDSIMADQLAGQWYTQACGLPPIVPEDHILSTLKKIFDFNVRQFEDGEMGAVNGMRPDGWVDTSSMQPQEVWTGTTYALAAAMLQAGMNKEAFATAKGIANMTYNDLGYWFCTPEAWNYMGDYRSLAYMRPLAIWAMQWAWEERGNKK